MQEEDNNLGILGEYSQMAEDIAIELDGILADKEVPTHVVVNAISTLLIHSMAQMYSSAYNLGDLRMSIVEITEGGIQEIVKKIRNHINELGLDRGRVLN